MLPIADGAGLVFVARVGRGLSLRTTGGATPAQIATMLWLFLLGVAALAILDPIAARRGEAPLLFARLRPLQMLIPIAAVIAVLARDRTRSGT